MVLSTVGAWALVKYRDQPIKIIKDLPSGFRTFGAWDLGMADLSTYVSPSCVLAGGGRVCADLLIHPPLAPPTHCRAPPPSRWPS